jgi:alpha-glucosidase (family GH31 glycosyl hydrolase)
VFALAPSVAGAATVSSGPLRASVPDAGAWSLTFAQQHGAGLSEAGAAGEATPGRIGFRTLGRWVQATDVVSTRADGQGVVATVATDDAAGRQISVRIEPAGSGVLSVSMSVSGSTADVSAVGIGFSASAGERFYGLGERSISVDQRGQDVENYVSDGPFVESSRKIVSATIPPQGFRDRDDATYYPVPWLLSSRGVGVLLDRDEPSTFHMATDPKDAWSIDAQAPALDFRVFAGPTPATALRRFTAATGRQPAPTAAWQFGPWFQTGQPNIVPLTDEKQWIELLRKADAPVSVGETQLRYLPCGLDRGNEDYEAQRVKLFHDSGLAILTYVNPMVCESYTEVFGAAAAAGALQRNAAGAPYTFNSFVGGTGPLGFTVQPVAEFDFTSPAGIESYSTILKKMLDAGHDGWMEDFGEYTPTDTSPRDDTAPAQMHNRYPATYHCAVHQALQRGLAPRPIVRFQRSGWTGAAACASDVWGGDPTTTFGFDGLSSAVKQALSMGLSGVSRWGSDIGGYDTFGDDPQLNPELLRRWIEFGAVSGVMRTKKSGLAIPGYERPQIWEKGIVGTWRRYAKLHTQLYPYILAADAHYRATGMPLMRALVLEHPRDRRAQAAEDEFGFGDDLLAAPVVAAGQRKRKVYLPRGRWLDFNRDVAYRRRDGSFHVTGGHVLRGGRTITAAAPLDVLALYVRRGAILPLLSPDVATLAGYGNGIVHLRDRLDRLRLLVFPHGTSRGRAFERDRFTSVARRGSWRLVLRGTRARRYEVEAALGFRPCRVTVDGRPLARDGWRSVSGVLRATFRARRATLRASRAC